MAHPFFEQNEREIADWLLASAANQDFSPFPLRAEPSVESQLADLVAEQPLVKQQTFRRAVATAISEWVADVHGFEALRTLAVLAAYLRTTDVIMQLSHLVRTHLLPLLMHADRTKDIVETIGTLAAVIAGFSPHPHANAASEALYYDDRLPPRLLPVLLTALCRAYPHTYPQYLPRTLLKMRDHPDQYPSAMILDRVVATVTPALFAKHYFDLDAEMRKTLARFLSAPGKSRIALIADYKTISLETRFGGDTTVWQCPAPVPERMSVGSLATTYDPIVKNYQGVDSILEEMGQTPEVWQ